jgi:hypothetical protein
VTDGTDTFEDLVADRLGGLDWPRLLALGPAAFVAGYVVTVLVVVLGPSSVSGDPADVLLLLVFLFYSAHNVPLAVDGVGQIDWLAQAGSGATPPPAVPVAVFYAIPILVLLGGGAVLARRLDGVDDPVRVGAAVGALAASYAVVAVAGTVLFRESSVFGGTARLVPVDAAVYGLAYPLAFATIGAVVTVLLGHLRGRRSSRE